MTLQRSLRFLLAAALVLLFLAALLLSLFLTDVALDVSRKLDQQPRWVTWLVVGGGGLISTAFGLMLVRLIRPARRSTDKSDEATPEVIDEDTLSRRLDAAEQAAIDTKEVRAELEVLSKRRQAGEIHVAVFGEISSGKSSLIRALLPDSDAPQDVRGGTTRNLHRYQWQSPAGDTLVVTDMPGIDEIGGELDELAQHEAQRAHIVVYVCEGDLSRKQHRHLARLHGLGKPVLLTLNKTDRHTRDEIELIRNRLCEYLADHPQSRLALVNTGGEQEIITIDADGRETRTMRPVAPDIADLRKTLQRMLDEDPQTLNTLRDAAVFVLAAEKLGQAEAAHREQASRKLVEGYTQKAVVGALAAVTPGTDLLIQGWLATQMVKQLAAIYEVPVRKIDTDTLLELAQAHVGRSSTLLLALAGNAFKAFPGIGTLTGGVLHAVAYGLIFRSLGRALTQTLATRGELHPRLTAQQFKELMGENPETSAASMAKIVIEKIRQRERRDDPG